MGGVEDGIGDDGTPKKSLSFMGAARRRDGPGAGVPLYSAIWRAKKAVLAEWTGVATMLAPVEVSVEVGAGEVDDNAYEVDIPVADVFESFRAARIRCCINEWNTGSCESQLSQGGKVESFKCTWKSKQSRS